MIPDFNLEVKGVIDEYGCVNATDAAFDYLSEKLLEGENLIFSYAPGNNTAYNLVISSNFLKVGTLVWGGKPDGAWVVSLMHHGTFWFDFISENLLHEDYIGEKLQISGEDAKAVGHLLSEIRTRCYEKSIS